MSEKFRSSDKVKEYSEKILCTNKSKRFGIPSGAQSYISIGFNKKGVHTTLYYTKGSETDICQNSGFQLEHLKKDKKMAELML